MTSAFDSVAPDFERFRALPAGVPQAIRSAIHAVARVPSPASVLDLGAGTGRFGKAFIDAGDSYTGVDTSLAMLREFKASAGGGFLAQADGRQLPFHNGVFDVVLLLHVLTGADDPQAMIREVQRVCRSGGVVAVGKTVSSESGIDAQLKHQLKLILEELGVSWHRPQKSYRESLSLLDSFAARHVHSQAASWNRTATPREFFMRHRSGARFAALPPSIQEQAFQKLSAWAEKTFASLDKEFNEQRSFELEIFEL
jgi:ubiquinone/menaquinone biosynthesis C-methylase UbiE